VPTEDGSEIWLESTSGGVGSLFHRECVKAIKGRSPFRFVFVPWFLNDAYRSAVPDPVVLHDAEEAALVDRSALDDSQLAWRRAKIAELGIDSFRREYPSTPEEAFIDSSVVTFLDPTTIRAAVGRRPGEQSGPAVWALVPGRFVGERALLAKRRGETLLEPVLELHADAGSRVHALAAALVAALERTSPEDRPERVLIPDLGAGSALAETLRDAGLPVFGVDPARRADLWHRARAWFNRRTGRIPDDSALVLDLVSPAIVAGVLERGDETAARLGFAPDTAEAFVTTFA
jgi:hypothetical protein